MGENGDILDATEEELGTVIYRLEDTIKKIVGIVEPIPSALNNIISDVAHLKLVTGAKDTIESATDVAENATDAAGAGISTAGAAVGTVPAVATDVLEDSKSVAGTTTRGSKSIFKRKIKR